MVVVTFLVGLALAICGGMLVASGREKGAKAHQEVKIGLEKITGAVKVTGGGLLLVAGLGTMIALAVLHWKVIIPLILLIGAGAAGEKESKKRLNRGRKRH